jgi:Holliday junction DNA helicase RuvA
MISFIKGKLVEKSPTDIVVEANGLGYHLHISLNTYSALPDNDFVKLYTYLQIKEDAHTLYGFAEKSERELFKLLISVNGIGAGIARTMLSSMNPEEIIQGIANGDVNRIQSIKGIGIKTAQRVIIDLKDKVLKLYQIKSEDLSFLHNTNKEEALSALEVLGFNKKNAEKIISDILKSKPEATVEILIKEALRVL